MCVIAPELGASFIDKHVNHLLPGRTVAVALYDHHPHAAMFPPRCPVLKLDKWALQHRVRVARRLGFSMEEMRLARVERFLRQHNVTVVLGEFMDQLLQFVPLLDRMGVPYVVQAHGIDVSAALREPGMPERYLAYRSARAILTRSAFHRRRLIDLGLPAEKIHVNPGGVEAPSELPERSVEASRRFLTVGRMVPQKGPLLLLEAFRLAARQDPTLSLDYVGEGPLFEGARMFVDACELKDSVRLHGTVDEAEKTRLLRECGVFVQHSMTAAAGNEEGLPAAIQEAMAYGMAVVSTRHAGIPEAVVDGQTGILVDEGEVRGMADAFLAVPHRAAEMGREGYKRAARCYTWEHEKSRLEQFLSLGIA